MLMRFVRWDQFPCVPAAEPGGTLPPWGQPAGCRRRGEPLAPCARVGDHIVPLPDTTMLLPESATALAALTAVVLSLAMH